MVLSRPAAILMALVPVALVAALAVMASGGSSPNRAAPVAAAPTPTFDAGSYAALRQFIALDQRARHTSVRQVRTSCAKVGAGAHGQVASDFGELCEASVTTTLSELRLSTCRGGTTAACAAALRTFGARLRQQAELRQSIEDALSPGQCLTLLHTQRAAAEARLADASQQLAIAVGGATTIDDIAAGRDAFLADLRAAEQLRDPLLDRGAAAGVLRACRPEAA